MFNFKILTVTGMKKYYSIILLALAGTLLSACEDFLEKHPLDELSSQTFWKNEKDADMALAGMYSRLLNSSYDINRIDLDAISDDFFLFGTYGRVDNIAKGLVEPTTGGVVSTIYGDSYKGVTACNVFLDNIDRAEFNETKKNTYKGEALFLRALFYFTLTEIYGGVPYYKNSVTLEKAFVKQTPKAEIVDNIVEDLDVAAGLLPDVAYVGHAVKGSALALKAKVLMHNERWAEAADAADQVIQAKKFSLTNNYKNLFLAAGQEKNPEIIFSARYLNPDRYATDGVDMKYGASAALNATTTFMDEFECTDGLPITESALYNPANIFANRDPRLALTIRHASEPITNPANGLVHNNNLSGLHSPYLIRKYVDATHLPFSFATRSDQDYIFLRYADVLLMYAECQNEDAGPDQSVYDAVNAVRARVGVNMPALPAGLSKDEMRERIRHERRVELGGEGLRYLDIKRWRTAETIIPNITDPGGVKRQFDPAKHYVFPFPQSEVDVNPNLDQNPNY